MEEEWSKGCYVGVAGPGVLTSCGEGYKAPFGKIHWAGTEVAKVIFTFCNKIQGVGRVH